ncbi:hypothetical protein F6R98_17750 [Candidatus Methylospira mobilis]|uniref:Class I SAM-dependent methyltransferase n=1 Tax=Candidatus Methylospira mobilis TaxID=1808979 RepID=A0A5Q0BKE6_9GAMM|nr:hypothetical protein [Candidatus Methylospira mobilis]QFY44250.1 hypothetical protein F6R98_17750 [Candidatus Methylospira mobilis]
MAKPFPASASKPLNQRRRRIRYSLRARRVSPLTAARCAREFARTSRFIRGLHAALLKAQSRFDGQTIHTLYAGCGPYATLILPLLPYLPRDGFRFTLIDIHPLALDGARKTIGHFGYDEFIRDYLLTDACNAGFAGQQPFHVAVTETMNLGTATGGQRQSGKAP